MCKVSTVLRTEIKYICCCMCPCLNPNNHNVLFDLVPFTVCRLFDGILMYTSYFCL